MRRRKNYLITLVLIFILWLAFAALVLFIEPEIVRDILLPNSYLPFFLLLFWALFFTLAVIFGRSLRGFFIAAGICLYLLLRLYGLGNLLNLLLIAGVAFILNQYFNKK